MNVCTRCGAELGIGRFCTNCGHPVDAGLFAPADDEGPTRHREETHRAVAWLPWVLGFMVLGLIASAGAWLLFGGEEDPIQAQEAPTRSGDRTPGRDRTPEPSSEPSSELAGPSPTDEPSRTPVEPVDLASSAAVSAPATAPTSTDADGNAVSFVATHMLDGVAETTWRMPGDGTGQRLTFSFDGPVVLREVGLINGYAKVGEDSAGLLDWYAGNRRLLEVEWGFDDGTVVTQTLGEIAQMQTIAVGEVKTRSVTLRLLAVTPPGEGRSSRDYTAISDVRLLGTPTSR